MSDNKPTPTPDAAADAADPALHNLLPAGALVLRGNPGQMAMQLDEKVISRIAIYLARHSGLEATVAFYAGLVTCILVTVRGAVDTHMAEVIALKALEQLRALDQADNGLPGMPSSADQPLPKPH